MLIRFLTDDFINKDPRALLNTQKMATLSDMVTPSNKYLKASGASTLTLDGDCVFCIGALSVLRSEPTQITEADLDTGVNFQMGKDYYVYACDLGGANNGRVVVSLNSTFPTGFTALTSRKIGGFHYGKCRAVNPANKKPINSAGVDFGAGWEANVFDGIVPASVWTMKHRPLCSPEGMTEVSGGFWVDIYLASDNGAGGLKSTFGSLPMTGTEGMTWFTMNERALAVDKRFLTYAEWCRMAYGSPQGLAGDNTNAWTAGSARNPAGAVDRAVSSVGARDAVGNVWEWLEDLITNGSGRVLMGTTNPTSYTYGDRFMDDGVTRPTVTNGTAHGAVTRADSAIPVAGAWGWDRATPFPGFGNIYQYYDQNLIALLAGGNWSPAANAGARCVNLNNYPWHVHSDIGVRLACDSL